MRTTKLLKIMADKKPRTLKQLAADAGMPVDQVHRSMVSLLRSEFAASAPVKYQITPRGVARSKWRPLTRAEINERSNNWIRDRRIAARAAAAEKAHALDESARTLCARAPNSVFALGGLYE
jgi:hypothetical protein